MIELGMVRRMMVRALWLGPIVVVALWIFGSPKWALSGAIGLAMTLGNLWLSATIIGGVAEKTPQLLLPAGLATMALGLLLLTAAALALKAADIVFFPVTGIVLVAAHLVLVLWEAAGAYSHVPPKSPGAKAQVGG